MAQRNELVWADDVAVASRRRLERCPQRSSRAGKPSWGGLVVRALPIVFLLGACSIGAEEVSVTPVTIRPLPPLEIEFDGNDTEARAELMAALAATGDAYRYETTITLDDSVMMLVTGAVTDATDQSRVARGGSVVEYRRTADGRWGVRPGDQTAPDWFGDGTAPLEGLARSAAYSVGRYGADELVLHALYAGGAVGAPDVEAVEVQVTIHDGKVSRVRYEVPVDGATARIVTVISSSDGSESNAGREITPAE